MDFLDVLFREKVSKTSLALSQPVAVPPAGDAPQHRATQTEAEVCQPAGVNLVDLEEIQRLTKQNKTLITQIQHLSAMCEVHTKHNDEWMTFLLGQRYGAAFQTLYPHMPKAMQLRMRQKGHGMGIPMSFFNAI